MSRQPFCLIAHRGYSAEAPENTWAAFDRAIAEGFPHIETDVQLCATGEAVVFHDRELDRHTNGTGLLADTPLAELQALDAGSWFGPAFSGQRVPTLRQLLARYSAAQPPGGDSGNGGGGGGSGNGGGGGGSGAGPAIHLHLELKSQQPDLAQRVAEALQASGWLDAPCVPCPPLRPAPTPCAAEADGDSSITAAAGKAATGKAAPTHGAGRAAASEEGVQADGGGGSATTTLSTADSSGDGGAWEVPGLTITSFHLEQLQRSLKLLPHVRHGWLVREMGPETQRRAAAAGVHGLYPLAPQADGDDIGRCLAGGHTVRGWGVKTEADLLRLVGAGAQGTTVDWPSRAAAALAAAGVSQHGS